MSATTEANTTTTERNTGRIEEVTGVVIEAVFPDKLPEINHAIIVKRPEATRAEEAEDIAAQNDEYLTCEVQQHLGDDRVRAVAMDTTDGLARGVEVIDTGGPITVPVGRETLGRIFNLLGEPIDHGEPLSEDVERCLSVAAVALPVSIAYAQLAIGTVLQELAHLVCPPLSR